MKDGTELWVLIILGNWIQNRPHATKKNKPRVVECLQGIMLLIQMKQVASIIGQLTRFYAVENLNINVTTFYDQIAVTHERLATCKCAMKT